MSDGFDDCDNICPPGRNVATLNSISKYLLRDDDSTNKRTTPAAMLPTDAGWMGPLSTNLDYNDNYVLKVMTTATSTSM
jgi:hypothetical protein